MWLYETRNLPQSCQKMKMLKVASKRTKSRSIDAIMEESHIKEVRDYMQ